MSGRPGTTLFGDERPLRRFLRALEGHPVDTDALAAERVDASALFTGTTGAHHGTKWAGTAVCMPGDCRGLPRWRIRGRAAGQLRGIMCALELSAVCTGRFRA